MARYTITNLRQDIEYYNRLLVESGSNYFFREMSSYGDQGVYLCYVDEEGKQKTLSCVEKGTSRDCYLALSNEWHKHQGELFHKTKHTRKMAKAVLGLNLDFSQCYFSQSLAHNDALLVWAKKTRYRKPQAANGSRCRYFYEHLQNRVKLN